MIEFLRAERDVLSLSDSDIERYKQARLRGEYGPNGQGVRARAIEADLVALRTMLNWATRHRNGRGRPLLEYNPLRGVKLPSEKNPRRPIETYDRYLKLMEVAGDVDWRLPTVLALVESTGQRISSILGLRCGDIDFSRAPYGWVHFRAEHQKTGRDHWVALSEECSEILAAHTARLSDESTALLFPADCDITKAVDRWTISRRLRAAYRRAGLQQLSGGLWHPWRRKWATERKGMPLKDVAAAGGWKETRTLLACYQQPDDATLQRVALEAPKLYANGLGQSQKLPQFLPHTEPARQSPAA